MLNPFASSYVPVSASTYHYPLHDPMDNKSSPAIPIKGSGRSGATRQAESHILAAAHSMSDADSLTQLQNLASALSGGVSGDMAFDTLFDNTSRRSSVAGMLEELQAEAEEHSEHATAGDHERQHAQSSLLAAAAAALAAATAGAGATAVVPITPPVPITAAFPIASAMSGRSADAATAQPTTMAAVAVVQGPPTPGIPISGGRASNGPLVVIQPESAVEAAHVQKAQAELLSVGPVLCDAATSIGDGGGAARVNPTDFDILRVVGQGAFGKVFQVRHRGNGHIYAMKVMRKDRILQRDHSEYVRSERDLLTSVLHPYIVTLRYSFQTPTKLYLVLDFINGGHLFFNLYRQGVFEEDAARLYTAEIVCAIAYLHSRGIVHRDLKPENVLLDDQGHIKITDFGLAKGNMGKDGHRTNSFIGTMEYMAPEIIEGKGHGKDVDWWSTGILLYEMLAGVPPFRAKSRNILQQQITTAKVKYPKFLSSNALSLLKGLLARDPAKRLGAGPNGSEAVRRHPFFKAINWQRLEERKVESKFKPTVSHSLSVENFDKIWTDLRPEDSPCGTPTDRALAHSAFEGFTYIAPSFLPEAMAQLTMQAAADSAAAAKEHGA